MRQYLTLIKEVIKEGQDKDDRTGTGTISKFATQRRYNLLQGFPLLTTKKVFWKAIVHELLWFIKGDTNIKYLVDNGIRIWNEWPYVNFTKSEDFNGETQKEFIEKIRLNEEFAKKHGELGPIYGKQWRNFGGVDQLLDVIKQIKTNPTSRRLIVSAWNPPLVESMALPPCHAFFQFFVNGKEISLQLYQRSADVFLGVPFNIASYSLLLMMVAQVTGLKAKEFIHTTGDTHIYKNHIKQVQIQLKREPKQLPKVKLNKDITSILDFTFEDIELLDYNPHSIIQGKVSI